MMHRYTLNYCVLLSTMLFCVMLPAESVQSATHGLMYGEPLPAIDVAGPKHQSKRYLVHGERKGLDSATITLALDAPEGAHLVVMGKESDAEVLFKDKPLEGLLNREGQSIADMGFRHNFQTFQLSNIPTGKQTLRIENLNKPGKLQCLVIQPNSDLVLEAQVKPLAARSESKLNIDVVLKAEQPIKRGRVTGKWLSTGKSFYLQSLGGGRFKANTTTPKVDSRTSEAILIHAEGVDADGNPFQRQQTIRAMVINAKSGIEHASVDGFGGLTVALKPAVGNYRLDIFYGYKGRSIAWSREILDLNDESETVLLKRPEEALAADQAVIKLLNMDTLGLEDQYSIALIPDENIAKDFVFPTRDNSLPTHKKSIVSDDFK